jgi:hypothetical protein
MNGTDSEPGMNLFAIAIDKTLAGAYLQWG